jgi:2-amino-4-hydroxy-6-hydroxymethyldihydropteridine diphosphokinase
VNAYLGLGSNHGDRLLNLQRALELLETTPGVRVVAWSSVYETEPVGEITEQPDFYNAVVEVETDLDPHSLLKACKEVERRLGRRRGVRHGPRPIDVDLLLVEDLVVADEGLTVPHPELPQRRFVLVPLAEVGPELRLSDGRSLEQALDALGSEQRVERVCELRASGLEAAGPRQGIEETS